MHDPTRIPRLTQALQRAWEGQPDLNFAQLIGVLQNRGLGWGTTDDETMELFAAMEREHPSLIDATATTGPAHSNTGAQQWVTELRVPYTAPHPKEQA